MGKRARLTSEQIKHLEPISALSRARLEELVSLAYVDRIGIGVSVFREGDLDNQTIYLLSGDVLLTSSDGSVEKLLSANHEQAKFPLDDSQPRQMSCVANGPVELLRIDNSVLDYMMMWDQLTQEEEEPTVDISQEETTEPAKPEEPVASNEHTEAAKAAERAVKAKMKSEQIKRPQAVTEKPVAVAQSENVDNQPQANVAVVEQAVPEPAKQAADPGISSEMPVANKEATPPRGDWMRRMNHIMAFKNMPPANIRILLDRMEQLPVKQGDTVVQQGESGDYFYVLTDGHARVTRTVELAELKPGASFGEESLVSGVERNASVTMLTDGILMRLAKDDFNELLKEPMLARIAPDEARVNAAKGDIWLDVRHAREFHHARLRKAVNIPLHELRGRLTELDKTKRYICYCNTGRRSSAAAFILVQNGFNASVLSGGVRVMPQDLEYNK